MLRSRFVRWVLIAVAAVFIGVVVLSAAVMAFVFSIGTAMVTLDVTAIVHDSAGRPVSGCLLAFERNQTSGWGQTTEPTDAEGRSRHEVSYSYTGSGLMPWGRERSPGLRFYLGPPPRYNSTDEVETWIVQLPFEEPWSGTEVRPQTRVERVRAFEEANIDGRLRPAGFRPLPADDTGLGPVVISLEEDANGRQVYRIPLQISLTDLQIDSCTRQ